ncbi:hypothetical protein [Streptomyces sp. NPDC088762]|uniref:hypothetical protein n=1 Tax=Streptomyces sp. NPDC088762 TaxID=3365891 RepID=UPI00382E5326
MSRVTRSSVLRCTSALITAGLAATALTAVAAAPAQAASSKGGKITRSEVMARAQFWVDQGVPYNQSGWYTDGSGTNYREDCSGYVSMAWHATQSYVTQTLPNISSEIGKSSMLPGDALNYSEAHVILFGGWNDKSAGTFTYYAEQNKSVLTNKYSANINSSSIAGWPTSYYKALRYDNIVDDAVTTAAAPSLLSASASGNTVRVGLVGSDGSLYTNEGNYTAGAWAGWNHQDGAGLTHLTSVTYNNVLHEFGIGGSGKVYMKDQNLTTGTWSPWVEVPGGAAGAKGLTAALTGDTAHLNIIGSDGTLYTTDVNYTTSQWTGTWTQVKNSPIRSVTSTAVGNTVHLYAIGTDNRIYTIDADYTAGQWTTDWAEVPGGAAGAKAITAAATANTVRLNIIGSDNTLYTTNGDYTTGQWTGTWTQVKNSPIRSLTSTAIGNTVHLYAVGTDNRIYTIDADYTAGQWTTDWTELPGGAIA